MDWKKYYQLPTVWQGRTDSENKERLHQLVTTTDLNVELPAQNQFVFLGFACDEGVRRNQGRVGAKGGPSALRKALSSLSTTLTDPIVDVGDIVCLNEDLESAQSALGETIALILKNNNHPIIFGGGHEIAWGHYQGIAKAFPDIDLGIINFDAHYDLRPGKNSSGTPFKQIADARAQSFSYTCIGIQQTANTQSLFQTAKDLNVTTVLAEDVDNQALDAIEKALAKHEAIYVTLCLDVFAQTYAPGVSAPQALGLTPQQLIPLLKRIAQHNGPAFFDVAELSPQLDQNAMTAKLAAECVMAYISTKSKQIQFHAP